MLTKLDKKPSNPMPMEFFEMKVRKAQEARDTAKLEKEKAEREFAEKLSVKFVSDLNTIRPYLLKAMELGYGDLVADPDSSESYSRIEHSYDFGKDCNHLTAGSYGDPQGA